jgi:hypothetical protein
LQSDAELSTLNKKLLRAIFPGGSEAPMEKEKIKKEKRASSQFTRAARGLLRFRSSLVDDIIVDLDHSASIRLQRLIMQVEMHSGYLEWIFAAQVHFDQSSKELNADGVNLLTSRFRLIDQPTEKLEDLKTILGGLHKLGGLAPGSPGSLARGEDVRCGSVVVRLMVEF